MSIDAWPAHCSDETATGERSQPFTVFGLATAELGRVALGDAGDPVGARRVGLAYGDGSVLGAPFVRVESAPDASGVEPDVRLRSVVGRRLARTVADRGTIDLVIGGVRRTVGLFGVAQWWAAHAVVGDTHALVLARWWQPPASGVELEPIAVAELPACAGAAPVAFLPASPGPFEVIEPLEPGTADSVAATVEQVVRTTTGDLPAGTARWWSARGRSGDRWLVAEVGDGHVRWWERWDGSPSDAVRSAEQVARIWVARAG